jgi:ABC-type multidrug transport system fused ATPase/permease subunit
VKGSEARGRKRQSQLKFRDIKHVWVLLPEENKRQALILLFMMVIGMLLEMLGAGLIIPIIGIVTDSEFVQNYPIINNWKPYFSGPPTETILWVMLLFVVVYGLKNLYLAFLSWRQSKFIFGTQTKMAQQLFSNYLHRPYIFHIQRNSAELINNLQVELNQFIVYMLSPGMMLFAEGLTVLGLMGLLIYFEPVGSLTVFGVFILAGSCFQLLTKKRISYWGSRRQVEEGLRMKHAQQGIGAIKDVKTFCKEEYFLKQYEVHTSLSLKMQQRNTFLHSVTRLWLEVLAIFGLAILYMSMFFQGKELGESLPILGLFAAVSFRFMPSINRIVGAIHQLRFGVAVTDVMMEEYANSSEIIREKASIPVKFENEINLEGLTFEYPDAARASLNDIELTIIKGEMIGLIGASGAGKSTLVDILLGLLIPQRGKILVDGNDIKNDLRAWRALVGYVPQTIYLTDDTIRRNIAFGVDDNLVNEGSVMKAVALAQLEGLIKDLPSGLNTVLGERGVKLSGGQRQRIGIARALYHEPEVLILDEATSALDTDTESGVMDAVENLHGNKTILIIAHRVSTLEGCDKIYRLQAGKIMSD